MKTLLALLAVVLPSPMLGAAGQPQAKGFTREQCRHLDLGMASYNFPATDLMTLASAFVPTCTLVDPDNATRYRAKWVAINGILLQRMEQFIGLQPAVQAGQCWSQNERCHVSST